MRYAALTALLLAAASCARIGSRVPPRRGLATLRACATRLEFMTRLLQPRTRRTPMTPSRAYETVCRTLRANISLGAGGMLGA